METKVFAIFDDKAGAYMQPFFTASVGLALRMFLDHAKDEKTVISKHPADFTLFEIGKFDDSLGELQPIIPHSLGNALELTSQSQG